MSGREDAQRELAGQLDRRRAAALRLPVMECGHHDPLACLALHERGLDDALDLLDRLGLCSCWAGGREHRRVPL